MTTQPLLQVAAKAAIRNNRGQVLIVREAQTGQNNTQVGMWSLVGGRLDPGESFDNGLQREVLEETGLHVEVVGPIFVGEWRPIIRGQQHQIIAIFMECIAANDSVTLSVEHDQYQWIQPSDRAKYAILEPDCFVVDRMTTAIA